MNNFFKAITITTGFALTLGVGAACLSSAAQAEVLKGHGEMHQLRSKQNDDVLARTVIGGTEAKTILARTVIGATPSKALVAFSDDAMVMMG
jgi:hypothetical protein